jgi:hypothetical protein
MDASSFDLGQFVAQFFSAAKGHNWIIVGGLVCTGLVQLARLEHSFVVKLVPWFGTDRGGVTLNAIIALLVTAGVSLATGKIDHPGKCCTELRPRGRSVQHRPEGCPPG